MGGFHNTTVTKRGHGCIAGFVGFGADCWLTLQDSLCVCVFVGSHVRWGRVFSRPIGLASFR